MRHLGVVCSNCRRAATVITTRSFRRESRFHLPRAGQRGRFISAAAVIEARAMRRCETYAFHFHPVCPSGGERTEENVQLAAFPSGPLDTLPTYQFCRRANVVSDKKEHYRCPLEYDEMTAYRPGSRRACGKRIVRVILISDTHESQDALGTLPPCDILIHAGDILKCASLRPSCHTHRQLKRFGEWFAAQPAECRILVPGNHDCTIEQLSTEQLRELFPGAVFLCNESVVAAGVTIWGSPISYGRSYNRAYQSPEFCKLARSAAAAAAGKADILVTHGPCHDIRQLLRPRLMHMYGHIHAHHGCHVRNSLGKELVMAAGPIMNHRYEPTQCAVAIDCFFCEDEASCAAIGRQEHVTLTHEEWTSNSPGMGTCVVS